jgi:hypothetical protein
MRSRIFLMTIMLIHLASTIFWGIKYTLLYTYFLNTHDKQEKIICFLEKYQSLQLEEADYEHKSILYLK